MRVWVLAAVALVGLGQGLGQGVDLMDARQGEVARLGDLYGIDLGHGSWHRAATPVCPEFRNHVFARYEREGPAADGGVSAFLAVYSLKTPPAPKDKPWKGGIILLPLRERFTESELPAVERPTVIRQFNRVWAEERSAAGGGPQFAGMTWPALVDCYVRFAGERTAAPEVRDGVVAKPMAFDLKGTPVSSSLGTFESWAGTKKVLAIQFDANGYVLAAQQRAYVP